MRKVYISNLILVNEYYNSFQGRKRDLFFMMVLMTGRIVTNGLVLL